MKKYKTDQAEARSKDIYRCCPGCRNDETQLIWKKGLLQVHACLHCDLYYANPVDAALASGKFYDRLAVPYYLSKDKLESDYAPIRFKREMQYFRRWCHKGHVLDIGCSTGAFLYQLKDIKRYKGVGMDVANPALDYAESRGIDIIRENFLEYNFGDERFDAITFWAVVEHLIDPFSFLQKAASLLKPSGLCFILVPNRLSLATRLLGVRYRYIMPDHINYFSHQTLVAFIERIDGLKVLDVTTMNFNPIIILQDMLRYKDRVPDSDRGKLLKRTTHWKQASWLIPARWCYDIIEACLGRIGLADNLVLVAQHRG